MSEEEHMQRDYAPALHVFLLDIKNIDTLTCVK